MPTIESKLEKSVKQKQDIPSTFTENNISIFGISGNVKDSGKTFGNDGTSMTVPLSNEMQAYVVQQLLNTPDLGSVNVASTANLSLSGLSAIDSYTPVANNLILAKNQTNTSQNGIYFAKSTAWVRAVFNKTTKAFEELTTQTKYEDLNINGGVVNVLSGNVGKNLQFQFSIQTPTATFGNSPVYVGATTKIPPRDIFNGFVSNNVGNDTNNNGSPAFPYASISKDLISASYPHCTTIASNGGSIAESITFTSGNSNLTIQSSDTTTDAGKTSLTGQFTFATGNTRTTFKNTTHSTGANVPFILQAGNQARHKFENLIITTTNPVLFDIDAGVLNWMNFRNLDCDNSPASTIPLPNFTAPFTINIFNQTRRLPFSLKAGATGLNCTIVLFNCPDATVRVPSGFAGTVRRLDARKVNEVILNQTRLDEILADTTLNGYYLISGFTPTSFKKGCVFGKQSAGGFTENWLEREFTQEQASVYDYNTKKTYIQENDDWVQYQTGGASADVVLKTDIRTAFQVAPSDSFVPSEKLTKEALDLKVDTNAIKSALSLTPSDTNILSEKYVDTRFNAINNSKVDKTRTVNGFPLDQDITLKTSNIPVDSGFNFITNAELLKLTNIEQEATKDTADTIYTKFKDRLVAGNGIDVQRTDSNGTIIFSTNSAQIDDSTISSSSTYSSDKIVNAFNVKRTNVIFVNSGDSIATAISQVQILNTDPYVIELLGSYAEGIQIGDQREISIEGIGSDYASLSSTINITHTNASASAVKQFYFKNLSCQGIALSKLVQNSICIFEKLNITGSSTLANTSNLLPVALQFKSINFTGNITIDVTFGGTILFEDCNFNSISISITNFSAFTTLTFKNCSNIPSNIYNSGNNNVIIIGNNTVQSLNGLVGYADWNKGNSYRQNQIVNYQGAWYKANDAISANMAFATGTTGQTWRALSFPDYVEWTNWDATIQGSTTNPTQTGTKLASYKIVGKTLHLKFLYQGSALSGGSGVFYIPLPAGYTADTTKVAVYSGPRTGTIVGYGSVGTASAISPYFFLSLHSNTAISFDAASLTSSNTGSFTRWGNTYAGAIYVSFSAEIPIL